MNPNLNVKTYATKMGPDTEEMFDDDWSHVCNASLLALLVQKYKY